MPQRTRSLDRLLAVTALGAALSLTLVVGASAQAAAVQSASIVAGSCAAPGAVSAPLANIGAATLGASTPAAVGLNADAAPAVPVSTSVTTVAVKLADLVDGAHAITIAKSAATAATTVACGNLGSQTAGGDVEVGLVAAKGSRYAGIAWLHADGDKTTVTVFLAQNLAAASDEAGGGDNGG